MQLPLAVNTHAPPLPRTPTFTAGPSGKSTDRINQAVHTNGRVIDDVILEDEAIMVSEGV
jgi:hypothetical protein